MNMNMKYSKGYTLVEIALVLVIIGLVLGAAMLPMKNYRDRAEYLGGKRTTELEELIAIDKQMPATARELAQKSIDSVAPPPEADPEPMEDTELNAETQPPFWIRWQNWWREWRRSRG